MTIRNVPLDSQTEQKHRQLLAQAANELIKYGPANQQTQAESDAGVTPIDYRYPPYNLKRYGGVGDNATDNNRAFADWKAAADGANTEGVIPDGLFLISANIELPKKVRCSGRVTGNFECLYELRDHGWVIGLDCYNFRFRGNVFCTVEDVLVRNNCDIDGYDDSFGCFWNEFIQFHVDKHMTIDITNWAVNLNAWRGGRIGYMHITGDKSVYSATQAHANTFSAVDFTDAGNTPSGVLQDDEAMEANFMYGCYFEGNSATIQGNFHIFGLQGDSLGMPLISRYAHIMGMVGLNQRLSRDFLSLSSINAATGGNWDILDSSGKPLSLAHSSGTSVSVVTDTSEPCGIGKRYEASFTAAFSGFSITIQPNGSNRFGLVLYYKSSSDFSAIESNDGSGAVSHSTAYVDADTALGNDWKMLRICGAASKTSTTSVALYAHGSGGGSSKTISIGGFFATGERAVISPSRPATIHQYATAVYNPASLADGAGVTTTITVTGAARGGFVQVSSDEDLQGVLLTAYWSSANTISVRFQNETGGTVDLPNSNLRVLVTSPYT